MIVYRKDICVENNLFIVMMLVGALSNRIELLLSRGNIVNTNIILISISITSSLAYYSLIVYGFINLDIWWHTLLILGMTLIVSIIVINYKTFTLFNSLIRIFQIIELIGVIILWKYS